MKCVHEHCAQASCSGKGITIFQFGDVINYQAIRVLMITYDEVVTLGL